MGRRAAGQQDSGEGQRVRAISSTSQRGAITPSAGGKLTEARGGKVDTLPPAEGVIGHLTVDGMLHEPRRGVGCGAVGGGGEWCRLVGRPPVSD